MPETSADHLLAALAVLLPLVGGAVLLWQRTTAGLKESVAWRARVDARLNNIDHRLDVGDERMGKYSDGLGEVRKCLNEIKVLLGRIEERIGAKRD